MNIKTKRRVRYSLIILATLLLVGGLWHVWSHYFSPTRVAFVNYQVITLGEISKANDNPFIQIEELPVSDVEQRIDHYDMVFINAMGIRLTAEQRDAIELAGLTGTPILTTSATNPQNRIVSLDSIQADTLAAYLGGDSRANYRSMLNYVRTHIDQKIVSKGEICEVVEKRNYLLNHRNLEHPEDEELGFDSLADYIAYLQKHQRYTADAPSVIITGAMGTPYDLCDKLEASGLNAFILGQINLKTHRALLDSIQPSAIVNFAHGRMGDAMVDYLAEQNIPLFCPLNTNRLYEEWMDDKQGMTGGFMSQSLITPEIDGALRPYVLFAQRINDEGLHENYTIPDRLETFVETLQKYIALKHKSNAEKKVAIVYFGSPEQNTLTASGMEGLPSLYNLMKRLKAEGYRVENLPASYQELHLSQRDFGNVALVQQPMAGEGTDTFAIVHGTGNEPPLVFQEAYRWIREDFKADALIHFGTHGGLEYTPRKQVALSSEDWPDKLIGPLPHYYIYTIGNVGEALIAKRRTYAGIQSHLTAPFMETELRNTYRQLTEAMRHEDGMAVKKIAVQMGIHRDLKLDSVLTLPWSEDELQRVEEFAEELVNAKMTGQLYTLGEPYVPERIESTVLAMATDPIAYSLLSLDKQLDRSHMDVSKHKSLFTHQYLEPARTLVSQLLKNPAMANDALICKVAHITAEQLAQAREIDEERSRPTDMMSMMAMMAMRTAPAADTAAQDTSHADGQKPDSASMARMKEMGKNMDPREALKLAKSMGAPPAALRKMAQAMGLTQSASDIRQASDGISSMMQAMVASRKQYTREEIELASAIMEVVRTIENVAGYRLGLLQAPEDEILSLLNALNGGYTRPSTGGDVVSNPRTLPTGRNLYGVNAEATPSETAWEKGKQLADQTIALYRRNHNDSIPRKVSFTLWSSEFIETEGASIAQILYLLGVEPVRDAFGRVTDLRLIPSTELGRPRIDVVVQTSGQLRDLAASRLYLINRAVTMAAEAKDDAFENQVAAGVLESERYLTEQGLSPKEAREMSAYRVFGGVDGNYGTGIQGMVQSQDGWQTSADIAEVYLNNMGAFYGTEDGWERFSKAAFAAAITRTDAVVQPRQSNTWGALSLDHVYEFMGGMNLAVEHVTGHQPEAYLADYRNRNNNRMQELGEAIGVESRTTVFNPAYIREKMKGGASAVTAFTEVVENSYGWSVTRQGTISQEMWDEFFAVYVDDKYALGIDEFMKDQNPAALETMTSSMLKAADRGFWQATDRQRNAIEQLQQQAQQAQRDLSVQNPTQPKDQQGMVLQKETLTQPADTVTTLVSTLVVVAIVIAALVVLTIVVRKRRKQNQE